MTAGPQPAKFYAQRAIPTPRNQQLGEINDMVSRWIPGQEFEYDSHNSVVSDAVGSTQNYLARNTAFLRLAESPTFSVAIKSRYASYAYAKSSAKIGVM